MTMHLAHPALNTTGRRLGKIKWASAEQKRQHQELEAEWQRKMQYLAKLSPVARQAGKKSAVPKIHSPRIPPGRESTRHIPSVTSTHTGAVSSKPSQMYTGTNVLGVTILHKSCLQPVFSKQEAEDAAKMRR